MNRDQQEKFAKLLALSAVREAQIKANPIPFLNKLAAENSRLRKAIEEAVYHLNGASSFDLAQDIAPTRPASMVETALERNRKAEEILAEALRERE